MSWSGMADHKRRQLVLRVSKLQCIDFHQSVTLFREITVMVKMVWSTYNLVAERSFVHSLCSIDSSELLKTRVRISPHSLFTKENNSWVMTHEHDHVQASCNVLAVHMATIVRHASFMPKGSLALGVAWFKKYACNMASDMQRMAQNLCGRLVGSTHPGMGVS
jgi:hypothetical protein